MTDRNPPLFTPQFVLLLVTTAVIGVSFSTYFLLPKYLAVVLHADAGTIGGISAVSLVASVLCMPMAGVQMDRRGRRVFVIGGCVLFAAACAGFLLVDRVGPLMWGLRVLQGIGWPLFYLALSTLATDLAPKERMGQAIGMFGAVMISTNALGPALAEWGASLFGWPRVFMATVAGSLVAAALARLLPERHRPGEHASSATMRELVLRPGMTRILAATMLAGLTFSSMFTFYQPWALACGFEHVAGYLAAFSASAMGVRITLGGLADRLGRLRVAKATLLPYILAPLSLIWLPQLGLVMTGALLGITHGIFFPALNAVAMDHAPGNARGKAMAAYNGAFNVGFAGGSYALGYVALATSFPTIFVIAALSCTAAFVLLVGARSVNG